MSASRDAILVNNISKTFPSRRGASIVALEDISLTVNFSPSGDHVIDLYASNVGKYMNTPISKEPYEHFVRLFSTISYI